MKRSSYLVAASLAAILVIPAVGLAQAPTSDKPNAPVTGMKPDRTTATTANRKAMQEKEAVKRQKRAECRAKAKAEHVKLLKRPAFVKKCTSEG